MNLPNDFVDNIFCVYCECPVCVLCPVPFDPHLLRAHAVLRNSTSRALCYWNNGHSSSGNMSVVRRMECEIFFFTLVNNRERKSFTTETENGSKKKFCVAGPPCRWKRDDGRKICVCIIRAEELSSFLYDDEWWLIIERLPMLTTSRNVLFYQYFRCCCCKIFTTSQFSWLFILSPSMESQRASVYERE